MKKVLSYTIVSLSSIFLFNGCAPSQESIVAGKENTSFIKHEKIEIKNGETIAYAYFNQEAELLKVSTEPENYKFQINTEVVYITKDGFYPEFYYQNEIACHKKSWTHSYDNKACYSIFSKTNIADAAVRQGLMIVASLGFYQLYGGNSSIKTFDYEKFYKVIEENNLIEKREQLLKELY